MQTRDEVFHPGERALQVEVGLRERFAAIGSQLIRDAMPVQHRAFFAELPWLLLGALDAQGQPWASVLAGRPGFVHAPTPHALQIDAALHACDPLRSVPVGAAVGVLGLQLETRRRNRANGRLGARDAAGLRIDVAQSFGNCPKHIHPRAVSVVSDGPVRWDEARAEGVLLSAPARAIVAGSDTYFIASSSSAAPSPRDRAEGVDVSHRGGPRGFVTHEVHAGCSVLVAPDYAGNMFFNTLGNLSVYPRAGLLFVDFDGGGLLALTAEVAIDADARSAQHHPGAERLLRFRVRSGWLVPSALPLAFTRL